MKQNPGAHPFSGIQTRILDSRQTSDIERISNTILIKADCQSGNSKEGFAMRITFVPFPLSPLPFPLALQRQVDNKLCSLAGFAVHGNSSLVQLYNLLNNRQA